MSAVPARQKSRAARLQHGTFSRRARKVRARVNLLEFDVPPEDHAHVDTSVYGTIEYIEQTAAAVRQLERRLVKRDRDPDAVARGFHGFADAPKRRLSVHKRAHRVAGTDWVRTVLGERDMSRVAFHPAPLIACACGASSQSTTFTAFGQTDAKATGAEQICHSGSTTSAWVGRPAVCSLKTDPVLAKHGR